MNRLKVWMAAMEVGGLCGCHQLPERSFHIGSYQFPLCARCTGILTGQLVALIQPLPLKKPFLHSAALILPMALDGCTQLVGLQQSTNRRRLVTGVMGGIGYICILRAIVRALKNKKIPR